MAPKQKQATPSPHTSKTTTSSTTSSVSTSATATATMSTPSKHRSTPSGSIRSPQDAQEIVQSIWRNYLNKTPQRTKLLDTFMAFLIVVGVLQFVYCVIGGNYPFNAFLSGFSATVGQFVLTVSLRLQTNPENKADFERLSNERAFADYVFGSMILHFFCVNLIN